MIVEIIFVLFFSWSVKELESCNPTRTRNPPGNFDGSGFIACGCERVRVENLRVMRVEQVQVRDRNLMQYLLINRCELLYETFYAVLSVLEQEICEIYCQNCLCRNEFRE